MPRRTHHIERHTGARIGWLRAAVLGANDGLISTASLIIGVAAAQATRGDILIAGAAGLVAGAMSMAAGEFVSVSSQGDAESADLARERAELRDEPALELQELTDIYIQRGVEPALARKVAEQMSAKDALGAHARDELGISSITQARPVQAALASAASFTAGAAAPLAIAALAPIDALATIVAAAALPLLAVLGVVAARAGGARWLKPTLRVVFWGALAMAVTAGVGALFGVAA